MFVVPGRVMPVPYAGCVLGPLELQFSEEVKVTLPFIRLVNHGRPLFIIGASDVLCDGTPEGSFGFVCMGAGKLAGHRLTQGWVRFAKGTEVVDVPLVNAPRRGLKFTRPADDQGQVATQAAAAAAEKAKAEHQSAQMRPSMMAAMSEGSGDAVPSTVQGTLAKLASS